jgi:hypothetical protein
MPRPLRAVSPAVKRLFLLTTALLACSAAFADEIDPKLDRAVREALPICADAKVSYQELGVKLPARFKGTLVRVESARPSCEGAYAAVTTPLGGFYLGMPMPIGDTEGATIEEKLKNYIWQGMHMNVTPVIDRTKLTDDGLMAVTLYETTENGKLPLEGEVDPKGTTFFFGHFRHVGTAGLRAQRMKAFEPFFGSMPVKGPSAAPVTIVEFSDFECPSCKRASGYLEPIVAKHGDKVRYIRFDLPLTMHPWAFGAALAGRAIQRQKPELFWEYKKHIYSNQDSLTAFTFWDFARGFAQDHELDLKRYDADLQDENLKNEILKGAGFALANEVRATPTYLVNGAFVDAGDDGKHLAAYVDQLLAAK